LRESSRIIFDLFSCLNPLFIMYDLLFWSFIKIGTSIDLYGSEIEEVVYRFGLLENILNWIWSFS